jgi:hypothetical protein
MMSSSSDADNVSQGQRAHHRHHWLSSSSCPPPPRLTSVAASLPFMIVKCPPLGSILVSVNSNAVGKDVGGGIVLEIVIGVALPIQDGLCCHTQESTPPTVTNDIGSFAPPPCRRLCSLRPLCYLCCRCCCGQCQGASNAAAAAATVIVVVLRPRGRQTKDDALVVIFDVFQEDDVSSASELIVGN